MLLASAALVAASVLLRLPYLDMPLTADEGGYAEIVRLWSHGRSLYSFDRPQGLIVVFRGALAAGLTSTVALREVAIGARVLLALAVARVGVESGSRRFALTCGVLAVSAGASPFIEGFTLSAELLASVFATASFAILLQFDRTASLRLLAAAGLGPDRRWS